jgi:biopolymer transport protein ExbD
MGASVQMLQIHGFKHIRTLQSAWQFTFVTHPGYPAKWLILWGDSHAAIARTFALSRNTLTTTGVKRGMGMPPRKWTGYALLIVGASLLFDTYTFLRTNWSPLCIPMYASNELELGYLFAIVGIVVLFAPALVRAVDDCAPDVSIKMAQGIADQSVEWRRQQRLPLKRRFSSPNRGVVGSAAVLLLLVPTFLMVIESDENNRGIYVRLTPQRGRGPDENCLAGPIILAVKRNNASSPFLVNGVETSRGELTQALKTKLAPRANWEVFVEAEDAVDFSNAMEAIEVIHSLQAKAVILTSRLKEEMAAQCPEANHFRISRKAAQ